MAQAPAAQDFACDVSAGCPCFALPAAACFAHDPGWRFTASGVTVQSARRSLDRHHHLHKLHAGRAAELQMLAARFKRLGRGFACKPCGKVVQKLKFALAHRCKSLRVRVAKRTPKARLVQKRRFRFLTPKRLRGKTKVATASAESAAAVTLPRDLAYSTIARDIATARSGSIALMHVNASSVFNAARLQSFLDTSASAAIESPAPAVGSTVWLPEHSCYGAIVSVEGPHESTVLRYRRIESEGGCPLHAREEAGDCWCVARPLQSEKLQTSAETLCKEILVPRAGLRSHKHSPEQPWHRCYRIATRSSNADRELTRSATDELLAAAALALGDQDARHDVLTDTCARIYEDVAVRRLFYVDADGQPAVPTCCPTEPQGTSCRIIQRGSQPGPRVLASDGVRASQCQRYSCQEHGAVWTINASACTAGGTSISGDGVGDFLVVGTFWPRMLRIFEETECAEAVRRDVTGTTAETMALALDMHPAVKSTSTLERTILLRALDHAAQRAPSTAVLSKFLTTYADVMWAPLCVQLARCALAQTGAVLNFDFSVSDCRQLSCHALGSRSKRRRTFGGVTALEGIPPLPLLYCPVEDRPAKETLLLTALTLMRLDGKRPMGANTDNLAADFAMVVSCLRAVLPNNTVVMRVDPADDFVKAELERDRIVVDSVNYRIYGFELGEDPLHIYMRLFAALSLSSREAAWAIRCLRKMLGSWNPLVRIGHDAAEHEDAKDEEQYADTDTANARPAVGTMSTLQDVLAAYFAAAKMAPNAWQIASEAKSTPWFHPTTHAKIPPCAQAVILDDIFRWANPDAKRSVCAAMAYKFCYSSFPTASSIREDLQGLARLLQRSSFSKVPPTIGTAWYAAQLAYLQRIRKRPRHQRAAESNAAQQPAQAAPQGLQLTPPGDRGLSEVFAEQSKDVHVNGLIAAFRIKAWAHANGFEISLGQVDVERLWRNIQRQARNKGRSRASLATIDALLIQRWMRLVQARLLHLFSGRPNANAAHLAQLILAKEKLAAALTGEGLSKTPLAHSPSKAIPHLSEREIGRVYSAFKSGAM